MLCSMRKAPPIEKGIDMRILLIPSPPSARGVAEKIGNDSAKMQLTNDKAPYPINRSLSILCGASNTSEAVMFF